MRVSVLSGVVFLTTSLGGALGSAAGATDCSSIKAALQGPRSVTYQQKLLPVAPVGGQASAPMTFVVSSTVRPIPNGYQVQNVTDGKTHVLKQTCVGGKLVTELDGKRLDMGASAQSGGGSINVRLGNFADASYLKHKVGEVWTGTLSSVKTQDFTMTTTYRNKLVRTEKITTPAGTFDTYRLEAQTTSTTTFQDPKMAAAMGQRNKPTVTTTTTWYAKDIPGLVVKMESKGMSSLLLKYQK